MRPAFSALGKSKITVDHQGSPYILYFLKTLFAFGQNQRKVSEVTDNASTWTSVPGHYAVLFFLAMLHSLRGLSSQSRD